MKDILACSYLAELSENETEQEFCVFLIDYLKRLAELNSALKTPNFNSSAFFKVID
ncbi:hypothetical protein HLH17_14960 [Acinetobacter sp. ANC 5380]|uniref:Uncharacterized protein n=1 Tax=Acinetobacter terrae TaxID=2731247 RepID=A0A7Y2WC06_9GAMM|nr:hypothetical protein [Acinetobacter terrae]NNH78921.1 hypothetical protein [Acinetobacter terrae]